MFRSVAKVTRLDGVRSFPAFVAVFSSPFPHLFVHAYATRPHGLGGPIGQLLGHFLPHASSFLVEQPFATFVHHQSVRVCVFLHSFSDGLLLVFGEGAVHLVCGGAVVPPRPTFRHLASVARVCACQARCVRRTKDVVDASRCESRLRNCNAEGHTFVPPL